MAQRLHITIFIVLLNALCLFCYIFPNFIYAGNSWKLNIWHLEENTELAILENYWFRKFNMCLKVLNNLMLQNMVGGRKRRRTLRIFYSREESNLTDGVISLHFKLWNFITTCSACTKFNVSTDCKTIHYFYKPTHTSEFKFTTFQRLSTHS